MGRMARWFARMLARAPRSRRVLAGATGPQHVVVTHGDTFTTWLGALLGRADADASHARRVRTTELQPAQAVPGGDQPADHVPARQLLRLSQDEAAVANLRRYRGEKFDTQRQHADRHAPLRSSASSMKPRSRFRQGRIVVVDDPPLRERLRPGTVRARSSRPRGARGQIRRPVHSASRDRRAAREARRSASGSRRTPRIQLLPRLEYLPFLRLVHGAEFVVSDGGGNQEELSYLGMPTLIMRDETERSEGLGENAVLADSIPTIGRLVSRGYGAVPTAACDCPDGSPAGRIVGLPRDARLRASSAGPCSSPCRTTWRTGEEHARTSS